MAWGERGVGDLREGMLRKVLRRGFWVLSRSFRSGQEWACAAPLVRSAFAPAKEQPLIPGIGEQENQPGLQTVTKLPAASAMPEDWSDGLRVL